MSIWLSLALVSLLAVAALAGLYLFALRGMMIAKGAVFAAEPVAEPEEPQLARAA